jgi:hypothetical protein
MEESTMQDFLKLTEDIILNNAYINYGSFLNAGNAAKMIMKLIVIVYEQGKKDALREYHEQEGDK